MALIDCNDAVFDRQANQILEMLEQGMSKNDIAKALGYSNPLSIDNYMRRRNFSWDSREKNFVPAAERYSAAAKNNVVPLRGTSKVDLVISLFDQGDLNVKDIAKQVGFETNKEMAKYMKSKGYQWDPVQGNYIVGINSTSPVVTSPTLDGSVSQLTQNGVLSDFLNSLVPLLNNLNPAYQNDTYTNQSPFNEIVIPRYSLLGQYTTKGMRMSIGLDEMMRKFSAEKNISQREIIEVAMIEFFQKYGYKSQIDNIIIG